MRIFAIFLLLGVITGGMVYDYFPGDKIADTVVGWNALAVVIALLVSIAVSAKFISSLTVQKYVYASCFYVVGLVCVTNDISLLLRHSGECDSPMLMQTDLRLSKSGKVYFADALLTDGTKILVSVLRKGIQDSLETPSHRPLTAGDVIIVHSAIDTQRTGLRGLSQGYGGSVFLVNGNWSRMAETDCVPGCTDLRSNTPFEVSLYEQVRCWFTDKRKHLLSYFYRSGMTDDEYAVAAAMSLGDKTSLTGELRAVYSKGGASHVLALSGLHIGIVYYILNYFFTKLALLILVLPNYLYWCCKGVRTKALWRVIASRNLSYSTVTSVVSFIVLSIIWCYVFLVGMSASVVRAATMLTVYSIARMFSRNADSLSVLSLALLIMLLVSPLSVYDVGFQLSYLAVLGIAVFFEKLCNVLYALFPMLANQNDSVTPDYSVIRSKKWFVCVRKAVVWCWTCACVSLSAQIMVLPLVVYYFGVIACYSLLSNFVVSVFAGFIVVIAFFILILSSISLWWASAALANILSLIIKLQNTFLEWETTLPGAVIEDTIISPIQLLLIYIIIAAVYVLFRRLSLSNYRKINLR